VDWVTGACLVFRRAAFEALGGFDPGYFLYYEEVDLLARARERGWRTCFEPALEVTHANPLAQRAPDSRLVPVVRYSQMRWFRRHRPRWELWALAALVTAWSLAGSIRRWLQGGPGVDFGAVRRAVRSALRGGPGPQLQEREARA
jgi:N-acetylglucosaminyl-diphospho-decaprenol L-rhamnosyltransferase